MLVKEQYLVFLAHNSSLEWYLMTYDSISFTCAGGQRFFQICVTLYYWTLIIPDSTPTMFRRHVVCRLHLTKCQSRDMRCLLISKNSYKVWNWEYMLKHHTCSFWIIKYYFSVTRPWYPCSKQTVSPCDKGTENKCHVFWAKLKQPFKEKRKWKIISNGDLLFSIIFCFEFYFPLVSGSLFALRNNSTLAH